ncbi:MAG: mercuric reductase [Gemmatimonadaceae bacterium]
MQISDAERERLENVHPPDWVNPVAADKYHLVVIGGGTGGLVSAAIAAGLGARTALIERHWMGGDCLNVGCVPSKALLRAARAWKEAETSRERFGGPEAAGSRDFGLAMRRLQSIRASMSAVDSAARYRDMGVDVFLGHAQFSARDAIDVEGQRLTFRRAVVATGTRPAIPEIAGLAETGYLTNETIFSLTEVPRRLVVIGGGPIGTELAQAFVRFGSDVTLVETGAGILGKDDPEAAAIVAGVLTREGVRIVTRARVTSVDRRASVVVSYTGDGGGGEVETDTILVATGRSPNLSDLGLDVAGIEYDERKIITDDRLRTSNHSIYAVGDITGRAPFTHIADAHARMVVQNALFFGRKKVTDLVIPWCTYTQPELAHVERDTGEPDGRVRELETITIPLREVDRARLDGDTQGFLRVRHERGSDRIVSATLVADHAGDVIGQISMAMGNGLGLSAMGATIFPYPTVAEVIRKAADAWRRTKLSPRVRELFRFYFRMLR